MSRDLRLPSIDHLSIPSHLSGLVPERPLPKPLAARVILPLPVPCWHCSKRLQACHPDGSMNASRAGASPSYRGPVYAYTAVIDGYERKLHRVCAEELGYRIERMGVR